MRSTFKLLYFVKRNAVKKNGNAPIIARITIDQVVAQFNTKLEINPAHWSVKLGKASGRTAEAVHINSMLESIRMDYIRTARAKGQKERLVVMRHALKNALLPIITVTGMDFGYLLGGAVVIETVFSLPGIGTLLIEAIRGKDIPVVLGTMMVLVVCFAFVMLLVDLLYAFVDPRIKARYVKSRH